MEIRKLTSSDAPLYREIRLEALKDHPEAFSSSYEEEKNNTLESYESRLNFAHFNIFGAFMENKLIGVVTLINETNMKTKHKAHIVAMYVKPASRKLGAGRSLMLAAINRAQSIEDIEQIYLTVTSTNITAKTLYQTLGFITYGIDKNGLKVENNYYNDELMVLRFN